MFSRQPSVTTSGRGATIIQRDLGTEDASVHDGSVLDATREVCDFWFALTSEQQFARDADLDRQIGERFGALRDTVKASGAEGWRDRPDTLLAAILLLDQFSRNIRRDTAEAFAADDLAVSLTMEAIEKGWEPRYPPEARVFVYMPLMHAEDPALQALSVETFEALGLANNIDFARAHRDVITRFGRFPSRNAALGRVSTDEEKDYLSRPGAGW
jgi:uncharacterized protein (DUF924 family)